MGGFPDRQTNFPNLGYPVLRITAPQKCDASVFAVCQMPEFNGQHASVCFLILFAEDVAPDKVRRRSHGLDLEVKGFVNGAKRCIQVHPQFGSEGLAAEQAI